MSVALKVPRLSLKSYISGSAIEKQKFSKELITGLKDYGFIILYDHSIEKSLLNKAYQLSEAFFALPESAKLNYFKNEYSGQRGYTPFGKEHAKDADAIDLKEFWHVGQELSENSPYQGSYLSNVWPSEVPEFKEIFSKLYSQLESTGRMMLRALCEPLQVSDSYFDEMTHDGNSILRILHYPPIPADADPRSIRAAAHEDINLITLLVSASASGLQLKDRQNEWHDIISQEGDIIVDSGDMLARISNEVLPATTHRVVNPADTNTSRYSIPFFMHPHPNALLSCLESCIGEKAKYPDITANDFLMQRLREIGLMK